MATLPNLLTIFRIFSVLIFILFFYLNLIDHAIILLLVSVLTDLLDGILARKLKQETVLGSFLDPVADKLLIVTTFVILTLKKIIPFWVVGTILIRDIVIVTGWFISYKHSLSIKTVARISGKFTIFFQMITLVAAVLKLKFNWHWLNLSLPILFVVTTGLTIISLIDYILNTTLPTKERYNYTD